MVAFSDGIGSIRQNGIYIFGDGGEAGKFPWDKPVEMRLSPSGISVGLDIMLTGQTNNAPMVITVRMLKMVFS